MLIQSETSKKITTSSPRHRELKGGWKKIAIILTITGIGLGILQIFFILSYLGISLYEISYLYAFYAAFLPLVFLYYPPSKKARRDVIPWYDMLFFIVSLGSLIYFSINGFRLFFEGWCFSAPILPTALGGILVLLVLETIRRSGGLPFFILCLIFFFFPMVAPYIPPPLTGLGFSLLETIRIHSMSSESIIGIPIQVLSNLLMGFIVFGVVMSATGGGNFFLNFSLALLGKTRGGPAKVAVISSALFGSISGSVVSNVLTTGSITIPLMKKTGYEAHYAGAVETCASTGGVLMPPIMGATAFVLAMFLGIPYMDVAIAAIIPSILYYTALLVQVDSHAAKKGIRGLDSSELPSIKQTFKEGWYYIFAFLLLIWVVAHLRLEAQAPFYGSVALLVLTMFRKETRLTIKGVGRAVESVGRLLAELSAMMAGVSFLIGSLIITGVSSAFASEIVQLAGGNMYLLLILGAITSLILGTGMTITACYVFLALLIAPVLTSSGFNKLAVHLFIMYYGMLSYITPPVAIGAFAAASLAEAPFFKTGFTACRLGLITFIIPFFFVMYPAMVLQEGSVWEILYMVGTAIVGIILMSCALEGYIYGLGRVSWVLRLIAFFAGLLICKPGLNTDIAGALLAVISLGGYLLWNRVLKHRGLLSKGGVTDFPGNKNEKKS